MGNKKKLSKMKKLTLANLLLLLFACQTNNPHDSNRISIFNGKDLTGWYRAGFVNGDADYSVVDSAIVGTTAAPRVSNSFLLSKKQYKNFDLVFEVKLPDGRLNSGIQIRSICNSKKKKGRVHGAQVEISTNGNAGFIYGEAVGGWISSKKRPHKHFKEGKWNHYRVKAVGKRVQTWINGKKIEDIQSDRIYSQGHLGLQVHSIKEGGPYTVAWRNIKIEEIK